MRAPPKSGVRCEQAEKGLAYRCRVTTGHVDGGSVSARTTSRSLLRDLFNRRGLIVAFAARDFRSRYRTSAVGWTWSLLQPLSTLAVFAVVFSTIFRAEPPELGNGGQSYGLYLFTGFVAWNAFSALQNLSMSSLRESGSLLRKVAFPAWAPVLGSALVQMVQVVSLVRATQALWLAGYIVLSNRTR